MVQDAFEEHLAVVAASVDSVIPDLEQAIEVTIASLRAGGKVLVAGNGGSASQAQHFAAELTGRFESERAALPAIALSADQSTITAIGNDYGFERIFARQVDALARTGDVLVAISTSGSSANVVAAAEAARRAGCRVIALTGAAGGPLAGAADVGIRVPSERTARIQEVHTICLHAWAEAIEGSLADGGGA